MNHSSALHYCTAEEGAILAAAIEDRPETVFVAQRLRRGLCPAYVLGSLTAYVYVLVEVFPGQLLGFGSDPQALWQLLQRMSDVHEWRSLGVPPDQVAVLEPPMDHPKSCWQRAGSPVQQWLENW